jgi:hypothetical protein
MRIYIVAADVQNRDEYSDYTTRPPEKLFFPLTVREDTENKYGEHVSIMGVYSTLAQAEHRWVELDREGFGVFPIIECVVDANCWEYIGGYAE